MRDLHASSLSRILLHYAHSEGTAAKQNHRRDELLRFFASCGKGCLRSSRRSRANVGYTCKAHHSLSYHDTSLTKSSVRAIPAVASNIDDLASPMKSEDTTASSVYPYIRSNPNEQKRRNGGRGGRNLRACLLTRFGTTDDILRRTPPQRADRLGQNIVHASLRKEFCRSRGTKTDTNLRCPSSGSSGLFVADSSKHLETRCIACPKLDCLSPKCASHAASTLSLLPTPAIPLRVPLPIPLSWIPSEVSFTTARALYRS